MKEATGELNMTVVTVIAIAAVAAFFYAFVWPAIRNQIEASTYCAMATCNQSSCKQEGSRRTCTDCLAVGVMEDGSNWTGTCSYEDETASEE